MSVTDETEVINLTPHGITVFSKGGNHIVAFYPPSGDVVRLGTQQRPAYNFGDVPVVFQTLGALEGFPSGEVTAGKAYIVSLLVLQALQGMDDDNLYMAPDTGPRSVVRDDKGNILGVRQFVTVG